MLSEPQKCPNKFHVCARGGGRSSPFRSGSLLKARADGKQAVVWTARILHKKQKTKCCLLKIAALWGHGGGCGEAAGFTRTDGADPTEVQCCRSRDVKLY